MLWAVCSTGQDKLEFQRKIVEALRNFRDASGWCECGPEQEGSIMGVRERDECGGGPSQVKSQDENYGQMPAFMLHYHG